MVLTRHCNYIPRATVTRLLSLVASSQLNHFSAHFLYQLRHKHSSLCKGPTSQIDIFWMRSTIISSRANFMECTIKFGDIVIKLTVHCFNNTIRSNHHVILLDNKD